MSNRLFSLYLGGVMTILQLRYLYAVLRLNSISKASQEFFVSQPTISKAISNFEKEYNIKFFSKVGNKLKISDEGKFFILQFENVLSEIDSLSENLVSYQFRKNSFYLGFPNSISSLVVPKLETIIPSYPNIYFNVFEYSTEYLVKCLKNKDLHAAFVLHEKNNPLYYSEDDFFRKSIFTSTWFLAVAKSHPLASRETISLEELSETPLILWSNNNLSLLKFRNYLKEFGDFHFNLKGCISNLSLLRSVISKGNEGTLIFGEVTRFFPDLKIIKIEQNFKIELFLLWRKDIKSKKLLSLIENLSNIDFQI